MNEITERWWVEIRLWPFVIRIEVEADVFLETRALPGMRPYECAWNDLVALFWKLRK